MDAFLAQNRWSGLNDGSESGPDVVSRLETNENYSAALSRILNAEVLFVDEVSV